MVFKNQAPQGLADPLPSSTSSQPPSSLIKNGKVYTDDPISEELARHGPVEAPVVHTDDQQKDFQK